MPVGSPRSICNPHQISCVPYAANPTDVSILLYNSELAYYRQFFTAAMRSVYNSQNSEYHKQRCRKPEKHSHYQSKPPCYQREKLDNNKSGNCICRLRYGKNKPLVCMETREFRFLGSKQRNEHKPGNICKYPHCFIFRNIRLVALYGLLILRLSILLLLLLIPSMQ